MSFYAAPVEPISPVPSYQASSQSGGTSPYANSVRSIPSVSTNPYSPTCAPSSPNSPYFNADSSTHSSPASTYGTPTGNSLHSTDHEYSERDPFADHDKGVTTFKTQKHVEREYGSNMRALELLEATAGADVRNVNRPTRDDDSEGIRSFKNYKHAMRERGANSKALMLLQETAGYDVKCTAVPVDRETSNGEFSGDKTFVKDDTSKSPDAGVIHLDEATSRDKVSYTGGEYYRVSMLSRSMMTARQEAEESLLLRKKMKAIYKLKKAAERELEAMPMRNSNVTESERKQHGPDGEGYKGSAGNGIPENLYISNVGNAIRPIQSEETEDIRSYKSHFHSARERGANAKALLLLQETAGYDVKCTAVPVGRLASNVECGSEDPDDDVRPISPTRSTAPDSEPAPQTNIHCSVPDTFDAERIRSDSPILTSRQEAEESKLIRKKLKAMYKLKKVTEKEMKFYEQQKPEREAMAESTRKIQTPNAEDITNSETIAAMKCSIDIERENYAKKKALQLLNDRPGCLA